MDNVAIQKNHFIAIILISTEDFIFPWNKRILFKKQN